MAQMLNCGRGWLKLGRLDAYGGPLMQEGKENPGEEGTTTIDRKKKRERRFPWRR